MLAVLLATMSISVQLTFNTRAVRVPVILQELSKRSGLNIEADGSFRNDVLVIRAEKVTADDLLQHIAKATTGQWDKIDGRIVLKPDLKRRKQQEEERLDRRAESLQRLLDVLSDELKAPYTVDMLDKTGRTFDSSYVGINDHYYAIQSQRRLNPEARLMMRLLLKIGAKVLATIERSARSVYSTQPTSLQKPLRDIGTLLTTYRAEVETFETSAAGWLPETRRELQGDLVRKRAGWLDGSVVWISIPDILMEAYDAPAIGIDAPDGSALVRFGIHLQTKPQGVTPAAQDDLAETLLVLDQDSRDISQALAALRKPARTPLLRSTPLGAKLMDPMRYEPLGWGSELYVQYAKARGVNMVALLNDNSFGRFFGIERITSRTFDMLSKPFMVYEKDDRWLTLTPSEPASARWTRDDRKALGALLTDTFEDNHLSLDGRAAYALTKPQGTTFSLGSRLVPLGDVSQGSTLAWQADGYRLYATLSAAQKSRASLKFSELTAYQRAFWVGTERLIETFPIAIRALGAIERSGEVSVNFTSTPPAGALPTAWPYRV